MCQWAFGAKLAINESTINYHINMIDIRCRLLVLKMNGKSTHTAYACLVVLKVQWSESILPSSNKLDVDCKNDMFLYS